MKNTGNPASIINVMKRAAEGEQITIGFIGGSITQGAVVSDERILARSQRVDYLFVQESRIRKASELPDFLHKLGCIPFHCLSIDGAKGHQGKAHKNNLFHFSVFLIIDMSIYFLSSQSTSKSLPSSVTVTS